MAHQMLAEGGGWGGNSLKVHKEMYAMSGRNFSLSAKLFQESTSYVKFVDNAVWISILALDRSALRKEVIKGSETLEVPWYQKNIFSLYKCQYSESFQVWFLGEIG